MKEAVVIFALLSCLISVIAFFRAPSPGTAVSAGGSVASLAQSVVDLQGDSAHHSTEETAKLKEEVQSLRTEVTRLSQKVDQSKLNGYERPAEPEVRNLPRPAQKEAFESGGRVLHVNEHELLGLNSICSFVPGYRQATVWANGPVEVWADSSTHRITLTSGEKRRFQASHTIHMRSLSSSATMGYSQIDNNIEKPTNVSVVPIPPVNNISLGNSNTITSVNINGLPTIIWADAPIEVWADSSTQHMRLEANQSLRFPSSNQIKIRPLTNTKTTAYTQKSTNSSAGKKVE